MGARRRALPDDQEDRALERAGKALADFGTAPPRTLAAVAISEWICARTSMMASVRCNSELLFNLGDARLRGFVEAALPAIANSLGEVDLSRSLFDLGKDEIVGVFVAGILGAQEAAVAANESLNFPFDDAIPFGGD